MGLTRTEGWEMRLAAALEAARTAPYALGEHDCLSVALSVVRALTGVDMWPRFRGQYATRREALRLFVDEARWSEFAGGPVDVEEMRASVKAHGSVFDAVFSALFQTERAATKLARRGDICKYTDEEDHLGVCTGAHVAVLKDDGLAFVSLDKCAACWRIG